MYNNSGGSPKKLSISEVQFFMHMEEISQNKFLFCR